MSAWRITRPVDERHALMTMSYPARRHDLGRRRSRLGRMVWLRLMGRRT